MATKKSLAHKLFSWKSLLATVLLALAIFAGLELTGHTHVFKKAADAPIIPSTSHTTISQPTDKTGGTPTSPASQNPTSSPTSAKKVTPATGTTASLDQPTGTFVSNHRPGQGGTPTQEASTCKTTPGASCYIQFSKDGTVKSLETQAVDSDGAAYWSWDVKDAKGIGLASGSWKISAVATLNGQTKTSDDSIALEIQ